MKLTSVTPITSIPAIRDKKRRKPTKEDFIKPRPPDNAS